MKFREAATSRAGTFYLAKGQNGAIYGALTFVEIPSTPGMLWYGNGETMIFSVTNKKIFDYVGASGTPIFVNFQEHFSNVGFSDGNLNFGVVFMTDDNSRGSEHTFSEWGQGFKVDLDAEGNNMMTGTRDPGS